MAQSIAFILDRASKSSAVATTFMATWTWDEKTPAQHDAMRSAVEADQTTAAAKEAEMLAARAALDTALDAHQAETQLGITLARVRHRNDAGKLATLNTLTYKGDSRTRTREEARKWLAWWAEFDAAWVPMTGVTLAAFTARQGAIEGTDTPAFVPGFIDLYDVAVAASRAAAEAVNEGAMALEDLNQAWYEAATSVFLEGTAEGDLIRGQVPTTYNPPTTAPGICTITEASSDASGEARLKAACAGATRFDWERETATDVWEVLATGTPLSIVVATGLPPGNMKFRAKGKNIIGESEWSEPAEITIQG